MRYFQGNASPFLSSDICFVQLHFDDTHHASGWLNARRIISGYILPTTGNQIGVLIDEQFYPRTIVKDKGEDLAISRKCIRQNLCGC